MTPVSVLDTGPLGMLAHPKGGLEERECKAWFRDQLRAGMVFIVPAIADYELRRELIRSGKLDGLARLDALIGDLLYLPIDRATWHEAAGLWATARREGRPTAPDAGLDADCILAAQSRAVPAVLSDRQVADGFVVTIVTTNVRHISRYAEARNWRDVDLPPA